MSDEMVRAMMAAEPWSSFWSEDDARKLVDAVRPLIRAEALREAAEVAQATRAEWLGQQPPGPGAGYRSLGGASAATAIQRAILALAQETKP